MPLYNVQGIQKWHLHRYIWAPSGESLPLSYGVFQGHLGIRPGMERKQCDVEKQVYRRKVTDYLLCIIWVWKIM